MLGTNISLHVEELGFFYHFCSVISVDAKKFISGYWWAYHKIVAIWVANDKKTVACSYHFTSGLSPLLLEVCVSLPSDTARSSPR